MRSASFLLATLLLAFNERDKQTIERLLDIHGLALRMTDFLGMEGKDAETLRGGFESAGVNQVVGSYFQALDTSQGTVKFMRVTEGHQPRSLVRFEFGEAFNYLEYVVTVDNQGNARTIDWYQLSSGELISVTISRGAQMLMTSDPGVLERLFGGARFNADAVAQLKRVSELQRTGKFAEAVTMLKGLPEPLASTKVLLSMRASMALFAKLPDEYENAVSAMAARYSDDPGMAFTLKDYYAAKQDVPRFLHAMEAIEKRVGVDGVTCEIRANAYARFDDLPNALKYAEESIRREPDRPSAYDTRAIVLVQLERYPDAVDAYRDMEERFGFTFTREAFLRDAEFKPLVESKAFPA
jgi:tetratricopeptide (TPR) repeat protein